MTTHFRYFEFTAHGFDGGTDETDDSVLWVKAPLTVSFDQINAMAKLADAQVQSLASDAPEDNIDFVLMTQDDEDRLVGRLFRLKIENSKRLVPVSEKARALVDAVWTSASRNQGKPDGAHAIDKLMFYIQQLENK